MWVFLGLNFHRWITISILVGLVCVRWITYSEIGFVNFDSAYNVIIAKQIASGDLGLMFNHAAPLLHLINGTLYWLFGDWQVLKFFHVLVNVASVYIFARIFCDKFNWEFPAFASFLLVFGTSLFSVFSAQYVSLEPLSILFFALILRWSLSKEAPNRLIHMALASSWLLLVNYKFLPVVLPVLLVTELVFDREKWNKVSLLTWIKAGLVFCIPIASVILIGYLNGKPLYVYPGSIYVHAVARTIHPALTVLHWNFDFSYYPLYFLDFEQPMLLPFFAVFCYSMIRTYSSEWTEVKKLAFMLVLFLIGMLIVQKAPRGLLFSYPILYALSLLPIFRIHKAFLKRLVLGSMLGWNIYSIQTNVFAFEQTNYPQMANLLRDKHIQSVSITSSSLILPFLNDDIAYKILKNEKEGREDTSQYRIVDSYAVAAGVEGLLSRQEGYKYDTLAFFKEPTLDSPLLWLESSEYNGWNYLQTLEKRKKYSPGCILLVKTVPIDPK